MVWHLLPRPARNELNVPKLKGSYVSAYCPKIHTVVPGEKKCMPVCDLPKYKSELNFLSKLTLSKEIKKYGQGEVTNLS